MRKIYRYVLFKHKVKLRVVFTYALTDKDLPPCFLLIVVLR